MILLVFIRNWVKKAKLFFFPWKFNPMRLTCSQNVMLITLPDVYLRLPTRFLEFFCLYITFRRFRKYLFIYCTSFKIILLSFWICRNALTCSVRIRTRWLQSRESQRVTLVVFGPFVGFLARERGGKTGSSEHTFQVGIRSAQMEQSTSVRWNRPSSTPLRGKYVLAQTRYEKPARAHRSCRAGKKSDRKPPLFSSPPGPRAPLALFSVRLFPNYDRW